ncbi:unnamed protein product [Rhizophagus irregularis]|nr:unnamed protein product [Rhizophagus irregularis]
MVILDDDDTNNYEQKWEKQCLYASDSDLDEFLVKLSVSFDIYIPKLQTFTSYLCDKYLQVAPNIKNILLARFISRLITDVIQENPQKSDTFGFSELLHNSIELLWWASGKENKKTNPYFKIIISIFSTIMEVNILEVLISETYGFRCLKRILFDFNLINQIEQLELLLKAVDAVAALAEKCPEHINDLSLSEGYKACTALLETLRNCRADSKNNLIPLLSIRDQQHLALLGMKMPQKLSDLPHFLTALEQRKIESFQDLIRGFPCIGCHKQALIHTFPNKFFTEYESAPSECFRLPFEFNEDDKLGPWDILLSEDTIKDLQQLESTPEIIRIIMKKLGHISSGEWDKHELRCIAVQTSDKVHVHSTIPVYEVVLPNDDLKILWQVDYGFTIRSNSLTQLVKIWAVTDNQEQLNKILKNLSIVHQVYTPNQRYWCTKKNIEDNKILPISLEVDAETFKDRMYSLRTDDELLMIHEMIVTNKFVPLSTNLYKSLVLGGLNFTFQVSKNEYEIINCPTSAIVVGRSGTGKTTCIVYRQLASYLNSQLYKTPSLYDNNRNFYKRQIFITVSPTFRYRVKKHFYTLRDSAMLSRKEISKRKFREYIKKKEEEGASAPIMHEEKDEEKELNSIPDTFNHLQLTDDKFPLFITFDKFVKMLQGTYGINNQDLIIKKKLNSNNNDSYIKKNNRKPSFINMEDKNFVNYKAFQKRYWPSLSDYCNQKFECELVYSEFSIIKGTNPEVDFLSREDYRDVSTKKYPVFLYNREQIYDLFEHYEKMKARNNEYDSMDRTLAILRYAEKKALGSLHIHEVYIDECQDNHIVDLALILKVFDRASSIFLAGDIAQCIAKGSSFRFQDLKDLMYKWEHTRVPTKNHNVIKPKQFHLDINYRSHDGILQLAASVVDLIHHFFPNSIDKLPRERAEIGGPLPIIFDGFQKEYFKIFSTTDKDQNSFIEFGAYQVIIVRDDDAKSRLKKLIGRGAMVMTVYDAKGMEFNDVLLYNFFTDSPALRKWRVILSICKDNSEGVPTFSPEKHYILSSELKHLYVAVTRAKQHLWICDENTECSMPIRKYWGGLVKEGQSMNEIILSTLAKKSDSREWNKQGIEFFENRQYEQAIFCFEKSGNEESRKLANAYYLREIAKDSISDSNDDDIKSKFTSAAMAFNECSRPTQAALCYRDVSMYKEAGDVYAKHGMFEFAARNYVKANNMWYEAGECFEKAKKYDDAAIAFKDGRFYEIAADFILKYKQEIKNKTFRHVARQIKDHYHSRAISYGEYDEAVDMYKRLIDDNNEDDISETLELILYVCRIDLLKETMTYITSSGTLRKYFSKANEFIMEFESQLISKSKKWNNLIAEFNLYSAYLVKDFNKINDYIQFFKSRKELAIEFHAVNIWLQILTQLSDIQDKHHHERLKNLQWMCELVFSFIKTINNRKNNQTKKNFEEIFCIKEINPQIRQIPFGNPLLHIVNEMNQSKIADSEETMNDQHFYDASKVHQRILKCLIPHIFEHVQNADQKGRVIPDISYQICCCEGSGCRRHHVKSTPSILYQRLTLVCLQYTVMIEFNVNVLKDHRFLSDKQIKKIRNLQEWWAERLVKIHIRYQSPQISCPEITYMQLQDRYSINKLNLEMTKTKIISHSNDLPIGFEYYKGYNKAIPVGNRLSSFFFHLYFNNVISAISNIKVFIQYAIDNAQLVNLVTSDAFNDLLFLIEFTTSLVFTIKPGYCDFCIPRAYLINYFEAFTAEPLISNNQHNYEKENYLDVIKNSFDQAQQLLNLLIREEQIYLSIILRLVRLLVLIGLNEPNFATKVIIFFKYLNRRVISTKIKKYLEKKSMEQLTNILYNDLKETGFDSLVIVHYYVGHAKVLSKFSNLEENGIKKLRYKSIKEFHSALQQIKSSVNNQEKVTTVNNVNNLQVWYNKISDLKSQKAIIKIQDWFRRIRLFKAAKKIQVWIRRVHKRVKSRQPNYDPVPNKIYNDVMVFSKVIAKEINKESVSKYNILLRGQTVDVVVELISLYKRVKTFITNCSQDTNKSSHRLKLEDELRNYHYGKVIQALRSLSITENSAKHKEVDIEWLKNELQQAKDIINQIQKWVGKYKAEVNPSYKSNTSHQVASTSGSASVKLNWSEKKLNVISLTKHHNIYPFIIYIFWSLGKKIKLIETYNFFQKSINLANKFICCIKICFLVT